MSDNFSPVEMKVLASKEDSKADDSKNSAPPSGGSLLELSDEDPDYYDGGDINYGIQIHKAIAKRTMDVAMLTANANQLRLLMAYTSHTKTFVACISLVILSLVLQTVVAICLIIVKSHHKSTRSIHLRRLKIATKIIVVIITVINILVVSLVITPHEKTENIGSTDDVIQKQQL